MGIQGGSIQLQLCLSFSQRTIALQNIQGFLVNGNARIVLAHIADAVNTVGIQVLFQSLVLIRDGFVLAGDFLVVFGDLTE